MFEKMRKYILIIVAAVIVFIPGVVYAETESNELVTSNTLEYVIGSNNGLSIVIDEEKTIESVSVDGSVLENTKYLVSNNSLSFASDYLDNLVIGNHSVTVKYSDVTNNLVVSFEVKEEVVTDSELNESDEVVSKDEVNDQEKIINTLPDYYFVSTDESLATSDTVKEEIHSTVIDTLNNNNINVEDTYNVDVNVDASDIYSTEITFTDHQDDTNTFVKEGTVVYSNSEDYSEEDYNLVKEFTENNDFTYTNSYELVDDFSDESYKLNDVITSLDEMFSDSGIEYTFTEIEDEEDTTVIGKVNMYVNSKYYASSDYSYKNVAFVYVPWNVKDINSYVVNKAYEILVNSYEISGHTLTYKNNHLYDEDTGYDFGELDYIIDDCYEYSYVSGNKVYEKLSNNDLVIKFDSNLGTSEELTIDDVLVSDTYYSVLDDTITLSYDYLNSLACNNYDLELVTNLGSAKTVITVIPKQYKYIDGADSVVNKNEKKNLVVRINADLNKFINVSLNNNVLSSSDYKLREGSTIIDISSNYLETLSNGVYKLKALFSDGEATTNVSISSSKINYNVNSVSNQTYEKNSNNNVSFNLNRVGRLVNVDLNGVSIGSSNYYVSNNSVVLKSSYLNNISNGNYKISIIFDNGSVNSNFVVKEKAKTNNTNSNHNNKTSGGSSYVPVRRYYTPRYYTNYYYDDNEDVVSDNVVSEENNASVVEEVKEESNILEVVDDVTKGSDITKSSDKTKSSTKKNTSTKKKSSTTKKSTSTKKNVSSDNKKKKSIFSIFKKEKSTKTKEKTETKKSTDNNKEKKSIFSIFKKDKSTKTEEKTETKKTETKKSTDSSDKEKKSLLSIFKKDKSTKNDDVTETSKKEKKSILSVFKKDKKTETKKMSSTKNTSDNDSDSKPMISSVDKIVNSRIFIASLIILICSLVCYILYMLTKKDEDDDY